MFEAGGTSGIHMAMVGLIRDANADAANVGLVQGFHRITRFNRRLGLPATPFDDQGHAFLGDLINGQAPPSIIIEPTAFHTVPAVRVLTAAALDQAIAAHPDREMFGPYDATDADTETIRTRRMMLIPSKYLPMVLDEGITPKQAWLRIRGSMVAHGDADSCQPLIDWLRVALTSHQQDNQPSRLVMTPPPAPPFPTPTDAATFTNYRWGFVNQDHPNLRATPMTAGAQQIAAGLSSLVTEQRTQRLADDARRQRDRNKSPSDYFGTGLRRLMRWCQVLSDQDLPPVYAQIAAAPKGQTRLVIQSAITEACENARYSHLDIQVTTAISKRIINLEWATALTDDLSTGLHPFAIGYVTAEEAEIQREQNREADMLYASEAAPSLADTQAILSSTTVHIPTKMVHAKIAHQRALMLWTVLLGGTHPFTTACRRQVDLFEAKEAELDRARPRNPQHVHLAPALITRRTQLDTNYWLRQQARDEQPVPAPDLTEIFREIELDRDWAPTFPSRYFKAPASAPVPSDVNSSDQSAISGLTDSSGGSNPQSGASAGGGGAVQRKPSVNPLFESYRALNLPTRRVKLYCTNHKIALPRNARLNTTMCLSYHVKGMCNERCGSAADHVDHTDAEDQQLADWLKSNYKTE